MYSIQFTYKGGKTITNDNGTICIHGHELHGAQVENDNDGWMLIEEALNNIPMSIVDKIYDIDVVKN